MNNKSAILYLENDADITEAIDLIKKHHSSSIKLVLPGRSVLAKSSINLKLLDSSVKKMGKSIVIITSDTGLHKVLSRYDIAYLNSIHDDGLEKINSTKADIKDIKIHDNSSSRLSENIPEDQAKDIDTIEEYGDIEDANLAYVQASGVDSKKIHHQSEPIDNVVGYSQPSVPNFDLLKSRLNKATMVFVLLLGLIALMVIVPSANIIVYIKAAAVKINTNITLDTNSIKSDLANNVLSANYLDKSQYVEEHYQASGKKDIGTKASGSVMIKNCDDTSGHTIGSGAKVLSKGKEFIANNSVEVPAGVFSGGGSVCKSSSVELKVQAINNGESSNLSDTFFTIEGMPDLIGGVGTTTGGQEKFIEIVSSSDVDNLKNKLREYNRDKVIADLSKKLPSDSVLIPETLVQTIEKEELSAPVGSENKEGILKLSLKYSITAVKSSEIEDIIKANANKKVEAGSKIYDFDFASIKFNTVKDIGDGQYMLDLDTTVWSGAIIARQELSRKLRFKSVKDVEGILRASVKEMDGFSINSSPRFWPKLPILTNRIKVNAELKK